MACGWETWHDWNETMMRPLSAWFCTASGAAPGHTVLDAACGTGLPALALSERVRPGGKVIACDISPEMLAAAERKAREAGADNVEFRALDMAALDFPDASFDAVTCSFGLMFCADPIRGASELFRVLRPGRTLAVAVWDELDKNPYFASLFAALRDFVPLPPLDPRSPGPFRLAAPGTLEAVLRQAGFSEIAVGPREVVFEFDSLAMHWQVTSDMAGPARAAAARLSDTELGRLKQTLAEALGPYVQSDRLRIPNTALCAACRR